MSSITIVSDAPNCGVTYDRHYDDRNSFDNTGHWAEFTSLEVAVFRLSTHVSVKQNGLA